MVTADGVQVGCPSGAGDSDPDGTTGARVGEGVLLGAAAAVGVGLAVGLGVFTAAGVELEHAAASTRVARLTGRRGLRTRSRLRPLDHGFGDPGGEALMP
jgi:tetrahydrodipicolinate N-succinyltransferase